MQSLVYRLELAPLERDAEALPPEKELPDEKELPEGEGADENELLAEREGAEMLLEDRVAVEADVFRVDRVLAGAAEVLLED